MCLLCQPRPSLLWSEVVRGKQALQSEYLLRGKFLSLLHGYMRPHPPSSSEVDVEGILQPLVTGIVRLGHSEGRWVWGQAGIRRLVVIGQASIRWVGAV